MKTCSLLLTLTVCAATAHALTIEHVHVTSTPQGSHFVLRLSAIPDLDSRDEYGRPKDQFGFWIGQAEPERYPQMVATSGEAPGVVTLWDGSGTGVILGTVPLTQANAQLMFDVPTLTGDFRWVALVFEYGLDVARVEGDTRKRQSRATPLVATNATPTSWGRVKALYAPR